MTIAMHPLVRGAAVAAVLTALGNLEPPPRARDPIVNAPSRAPKGLDGLPAPCGPRTLPEGPVCLPIPPPAQRPDDRDRRPREAVVERVPRLPDRPSDPAAYVYPIGAPSDPAPHVLGGFPDIPSPGSAWPMGEGIEIAAHVGEDVKVLALEHQRGDARVVFRGELYGTTIAIAHEIEDGARKRTVLVIYGYLDKVAASIAPGATLAAGNVVGVASDSGASSLGHFYLETREARPTAKLDGLDAKHLIDAAIGAPTDPRNVLPKRP